MTQILNKQDLMFALRRMPRALRLQMLTPSWRRRIFVGGGFLRCVVANEPVNDVDVFVTNKTDAIVLARELVCRQFARTMPKADDTEGLTRFFKAHLYETPNAITLRHFNPVVQIIHRWTFQSPEDVINSFDFSVCCAAIYVQHDGTWKGIVHDRFYQDLAAKRLFYLSPVREEEPGGSMLRVLKYYQKGYRMPLDSLGKVMARMFAAVDWKTKTGSDPERVPYLLTAMLRAVDPLVDLTHEAHLPAEDVVNASLEAEEVND
jgi:hypothetical protein